MHCIPALCASACEALLRDGHTKHSDKGSFTALCATAVVTFLRRGRVTGGDSSLVMGGTVTWCVSFPDGVTQTSLVEMVCGSPSSTW